MQLAAYPRQRLAHLPTPLEPLPRLSQHLGGPQIFVKRDDQTGLAMGGNKARKLEYLIADALQRGCDTLVTTGGQQSNHARQTAAAAARLGMKCELILPRAVPYEAVEYQHSGNVLLDRLFEAQLEFPANDADAQAIIDTRIEELIARGQRPYFIPMGGSTALGALGYVTAALELLEQSRQQQLAIDHIFVATGSAGTHAGILAGLLIARHAANLQGIAISGTSPIKESLVHSLASQVLAMLDASADHLAERVRVDDRFVGPGYGLPTDAMLEAVHLTARLEGLLLDPVYTGKAMAGMISSVRGGKMSANENVVFWHTGGTPALFAYQQLFEGSDQTS